MRTTTSGSVCRKVLQQSDKLSNIIHMLHNFRESSESGNLSVKIFSVTEYVTEIARSYVSLAQERGLVFDPGFRRSFSDERPGNGFRR